MQGGLLTASLLFPSHLSSLLSPPLLFFSLSFFFWILVLIRLRRIKNSHSHRYQKSAGQEGAVQLWRGESS